MSEEIVLNADNRVRTGTNKNREIRRNESMVPAVIYGNNQDTKNIKLYLNEITKASESELFFTQVLKIMLDGNEEKVVLKELQREPEKGKLLHADFMRVSSKTKLKVVVPIKFTNEDDCIGVKNEGGVITKLIRELEVSCLASNIPEAIELDLLEVSLNESLRLSDIKLEEGVEIPNLDDNSDQMVVNVAPPKAIVEDEPEMLDDESMEADSDEGEVKADTGSACYRSFKNIVQQGSNRLQVVAHRQNQSFFDNLLVPIFNTQDFDQANKDVEKEVMKRYTYEYFMVNVGNAAYQEAGSSMSKGSVDAETTGTAYKVYACGIYNRDDIIIPLESIIVLPG